jgi:hypothetical protein
MCVRVYDDLKKRESNNPTIRILLCANKDNTIVKYSSINENNNLFVSKYQMYLSIEQELKDEIERDLLELQEKI